MTIHWFTQHIFAAWRVGVPLPRNKGHIEKVTPYPGSTEPHVHTLDSWLSRLSRLLLALYTFLFSRRIHVHDNDENEEGRKTNEAPCRAPASLMPFRSILPIEAGAVKRRSGMGKSQARRVSRACTCTHGLYFYIWHVSTETTRHSLARRRDRTARTLTFQTRRLARFLSTHGRSPKKYLYEEKESVKNWCFYE